MINLKDEMRISKTIIFGFLFFFFSWNVDAQIAGSWQPIGPDIFPTNVSGQINGIGRITQIKFHPSDSNTIFATSASGGLWISHDNALTWQVSGTDKFPNIQCASVCVDYVNDSILYVGTGDPNYYGNGYGIYKSIDKGSNWLQSTTGLGNRLVVEILMDPDDHNVLVAATNGGIYKSLNGGVSWNAKLGSGTFTDMKLRPAPGSRTLYACTFSSFYLSSDFGETWSLITNGTAIPGGGSGDGFRIAVTPADTNLVYVGMVKDEGTILKSNDGGLTFITVYHNPTQSLLGYDANGGGQGNYNFSMTADPIDPNTLYTASHVVWKSTDGGITWTQLTQWFAVLHTDMHHIVFNPYNSSQLFNANDGGIFLSTNGGTNWTPKSDGLAATECYHAALNPLRNDMISIGTQDNGELYKINSLWKTNRGGDWGSRMAYDFLNQNRVYYYDTGNRRNILGGPEQQFNLPFSSTNNSEYGFTELNANLAVVAKNDIWVSTDMSSFLPNWNQVGNINSQIKSIHISYNNENVLYAVAANSRIYRTDDLLSGSSTFVDYNTPTSVAAGTDVTTVVGDTNVVYLTCGHHVYRSNDKGATWANQTYNLPTINIIKIHHDKFSTDESVYIASALGVWYKNKFMNGWLNYSAGLPTIAGITDFMIFNDGTSTSKLRVSYYGRGVWESPLNRNFSPVAAFSSNASIFCAGETTIFSDDSYGSPTSRNWNFPGGQPATDTSANPQITYNSSGLFPVSLSVSNAYGSNTTTKSSYILVTSPQSIPLSTGFEQSTFPPFTWRNSDAGSDDLTWEHNTTIGGYALSTSSCYINNYNIDGGGTEDELITVPVNFQDVDSGILTFDVAYARYNTSYSDSLSVLVSTDCGDTWTEIYMKGGSDLATAPDQANLFVPSPTEWRTDSIDLIAYSGFPSVTFSFRNHAHYGQALYLDNILVTSTPTTPPQAGFTAYNTITCLGGSVQFADASSANPSNWSWSFPGGNPSISTDQQPVINYSTAGQYPVTLTVGNALGNSTVTIPAYITVNAGPAVPTITALGNSVISSLAFFYQWYFNGSLIQGANGQNYTGMVSGSYSVETGDSLGCSSFSASYPLVVTGISTISRKETELQIFPNPTSDKTQINLSGFKGKKFEIILTDLVGRVLKQEIKLISGNEKIIYINASEYNSGIYFIRVKDELNQSGTARLIID
ncbi:hypothetical protein BH11BAC2_BH11BAC2_14790 [soil metagenome]